MNVQFTRHSDTVSKCLSMLRLVALICVAMAPATSWSQVRHELMRGDMAPGAVASRKILSNPNLAAVSQPVQVTTPLGSSVSVYSEQGFFDTGINSTSFGLSVGPVYRLRVSNIPKHPGKEVYPSIELINRLYPPAGLELQFPVKILFTQDDLRQALNGRLITKVIYLEDPETAVPYRRVENDQPYFDVGPGEDPLWIARRLGRPMAIVRIGSRVPLGTEAPGEFEFFGPPVQLLPDAAPEQNRTQQYDEFDLNNNNGTNQQPTQLDRNTKIPVAQPAESILGAQRLKGSKTEKADSNIAQVSGESGNGIIYFIEQDPTALHQDVVAKAPGEPISRDPNRTAPKVGVNVEFSDRGMLTPNAIPAPIDRVLNQRRPHMNGHVEMRRDEFLFDGNDRDQRIAVDQSWNIYGMDTEDTFGHFDTLEGKRMVSPSNRVAIYSPRFAAVRKVFVLSNAGRTVAINTAEEKMQTVMNKGKDFSSTAKQNESVRRNRSTQRANAFRDRTRGLNANYTARLSGLRNSFAPYENLRLIKFGRFSSAEAARLSLGMQSAKVWEDELGLQVAVKNANVIVAEDLKRVQQIEMIDTKGDNATLRVVKLASKIAAKPGDEVEFTIRFDNLSRKLIGNVTIIDNLTSRLEYIDGSAQSSLESNFISKKNEAGSLTLRWEVIDPIPGGEGGIIRFKCRVR